MNVVGAVVGGLIGGAVGASVWAGVSYTTNYEIGWIAWGIGALVGYGVMKGAGSPNAASGAIAVIISLAAIAAGKYAAVEMSLNHAFSDTTTQPDFADDTYITSYLADEEVEAALASDRPLNYPADADTTNPDGPEDYPADIWKTAQSRWTAMSIAERDTYRQERQAYYTAGLGVMRSELTSLFFKESFGAMDLLFGALAVATAFKLGSSDPSEAVA